MHPGPGFLRCAAGALPVARAVDGRPQISSIAVKGGGTREELLQLMQVGVRDVLANFTAREMRQAAARASAKLACAQDILGDLFAFMPAKPGCGATTIATYATAIARKWAPSRLCCWTSTFVWG
jgi:Flp pilus assembly CpaE family ATPase